MTDGDEPSGRMGGWEIYRNVGKTEKDKEEAGSIPAAWLNNEGGQVGEKKERETETTSTTTRVDRVGRERERETHGELVNWRIG